MKKNEIKNLYQKERKRVNALINRYKKAGYDVEIEIPKIPKKITAGSIRRLKKVTPDIVRSKSYTAHPYTGEVITAKQFINIKRSHRDIEFKPFEEPVPKDVSRETSVEVGIVQPEPVKQIPKVENVSRETFSTTSDEKAPFWEDVVLNSFKEMIDNMFMPKLKETVMKYYNSWLASFGELKTAEMLEDARNEGYWQDLEHGYKEEEVIIALNKITNMVDLSAGEKAELYKEVYEDTNFYDEQF